MRYMKSKRMIVVVVMLTVAAVALTSIPATNARDDNRAPELPSPLCDSVEVQQGHKVAFHAYALGVQIYRWNGISWDFVAPMATLYAAPNYQGKVGTHYAGPTWESNSGSNVVARRVAGCIPEPTAIPWLRLEAVSTDGPGIFSRVSQIQRVNTAGGLPPTAPGTIVGAEAKVPYTAEYYFYREEN